MNDHPSALGNSVTRAPTGQFRLAKASVVALAVLAACLIGTISPAKAEDKPVEMHTFAETRDMRFCEFLVVKKTGIEVYNTTGQNDCPPELWEVLDVEKLAQELGALKVQLNGPHFWMMDTNGISLGEMASFGGIEARYVATLDPAIIQGGFKPYEVFEPKKTQGMVYAEGKPVFELVDPDGHVYVLQAHDQEFPIESLPKLSERMKKLPKGWQYRMRALTKDLVLDLGPDQTIYAVGDEFHQYYTRIRETE